MPENIPNLCKDINLTDSRSSANRKQENAKKSMPIHIIIKLIKIKDKDLENKEKNNALHIKE